MNWQRIDQYQVFHIGDWVMWLGEDDLQLGTITEMANSPQGVVFWLSCAPFWVNAEEVRHTEFEVRRTDLYQPA